MHVGSHSQTSANGLVDAQSACRNYLKLIELQVESDLDGNALYNSTTKTNWRAPS